jgi:hypothetical protein
LRIVLLDLVLWAGPTGLPTNPNRDQNHGERRHASLLFGMLSSFHLSNIAENRHE